MKKTFFVILMILLMVWFIYGQIKWQKVVDRCANYNPDWNGILDCYGIITISSDDGVYFLQKTNMMGPIIAEIKTKDAFVIKNDEMYIIDTMPHSVCNNLVPNKYCGTFQVEGEVKSYYYDTKEKVPTYRVINTITGDEVFYVKIEDAPLSDQIVFQELVKKLNN